MIEPEIAVEFRQIVCYSQWPVVFAMVCNICLHVPETALSAKWHCFELCFGMTFCQLLRLKSIMSKTVHIAVNG